MPLPRLRVLQLNAGTYFEPDWDRRRLEVASWIDHLDPDVVCLQEICQSETRENAAEAILAEARGEWHVVFGGFGIDADWMTEAGLRFGSAIASRWPIDASATHRLPMAGAAAGELGSAIPYELAWARTSGLDVFSTHLAAAPADGPSRRAQVLEIDATIRAIRSELDTLPGSMQRPGMPPILCGDFNAEPDSDEIRFLCGLTSLDGSDTFYQDTWRTAGDGGPGFTQDWLRNELAASLNVHRKRIDYVFVGDPFLREHGAGRVLGAEVVMDEPRTGLGASDHFGLCVDIAWPERPGG